MKRGESGISCLLAIDKPEGCSSHDIVNMVRRLIGERRVGHAGTLDPFASGLLLLMAGPATRLDNYLTGHDKGYEATIAFGISTSTEDCTGEVKMRKTPARRLANEAFAQSVLNEFIGKSMQMPPAYSAIKVNGKKACDEARRGNILKLDPRPIEVYNAELLDMGLIDEEMAICAKDLAKKSFSTDSIDESIFEAYPGLPFWKVRFNVSKGTYIRSLARDIGTKAGYPAHLSSLRRISSGAIQIDECVNPEILANRWQAAIIDPVRALGLKAAFIDDAQLRDVRCGRPFKIGDDQLLESSNPRSICDCLAPFSECAKMPQDDEPISIVFGNALEAIYRYDAKGDIYRPSCVFNIGVCRG